MTPEFLDVLGKVTVALISAITTFIVTKITARSTDKKPLQKRENLYKHRVFTQLSTWKNLGFTSMKTGSAKKDEILVNYATLLVDTYDKLLKEFISNVSEENQKSVHELYLHCIAEVDDELEKQKFPKIFIDGIKEASLSTHKSILRGIESIQNSDDHYYKKVDSTLSYICVILDTQIDNLRDILVKMNGELEAQLNG